MIFLVSSKVKESFEQLFLWFEKNKRPLDFREHNNVYFTWLSEVMLQQTTVQTVTPYFGRFTKEFPTIKALAQAPLENVLALWSGLGYYSRARNLHKTAQIIMTKYSGVFPTTLPEILALNGIGLYTAGAILSIAYNKPYPILEANTIRLISRLRGIRTTSSNKKREWRIAKLLVELGFFYLIPPKAVNTALMEVGSLVCSIKNPLCEECPLNRLCKVYKNRWTPTLFPAPKVKKVYIPLCEASSLTINLKNEILIVKNPQKRWLKDLWDLPIFTQKTPQKKEDFTIQYTITNHKIKRLIFINTLSKNEQKNFLLTDLFSNFSKGVPIYRWVTIDDILNPKKIPASSALKKALKSYLKIEKKSDYFSQK